MLRGIIAVIANLLFLEAFFALEHWLFRRGHIPARSRSFLYVRDYAVIRYGDVIGLSFIDFGVFAAIHGDFWPGPLGTVIILVLGTIASLVANGIWLSSAYRPDSTHRVKGRPNALGMVHLGYFFVQACIALTAIALLFKQELPIGTAIIEFVGAGFYFAMFAADLKAGRI